MLENEVDYRLVKRQWVYGIIDGYEILKYTPIRGMK